MGTILSAARVNALIAGFQGRRILVVGDVMLDRFIWGSVARISPEAPVPIVRVDRETVHPGGAGNVVSNLIALGARPALVGVVGRDAAGRAFRQELGRRGAVLQGMCVDPAGPTIQKTRIIASSQQVVRVDRERSVGYADRIVQQLLRRCRERLADSEAVIISDYGKGVITRDFLRAFLPLCRKARVPVCVDPKIEHFLLYRGVACITPNLKEAMEGVFVRRARTAVEISALGRTIIRKLRPQAVLLTRGDHGMSLFERSGAQADIPAVAREVFDVTGAGDTVISVFTCALVAGAGMREAALLSNMAGGIVVGKVGTATITLDELRARAAGP